MDKGDILHIGAPITLLMISIMTFIFVFVEIKKRRLEVKSIVGWLATNIIYTIAMIYILIDAILQYVGISNSVNIFTWIVRNGFGIRFGNQEWVILLIFGFISFILIITMINSIRVQKLNRRVDELNREVAILGGKVNKTVNFTAKELATNKKTVSDVKRDLKNEIKIAKAKKKQKQKLRQLEITRTIKVSEIKKTKSTKKDDK